VLKNNKPHLSVIIPVFNEDDFIVQCLDAFAKQTVQPDVIYIIDNNSSDSTVAKAQQYANVTVLQEPVQGICATVKKGFDYATRHDGLMLRCDADCRPNPDWIEKVVNLYQQNEGIVAITGPGVAYETSPLKAALIDWFYMKPYFLFVGLAMGQPPLFGSNMTISASAWRRLGTATHLSSHQNIHDDIDISFHLNDLGERLYDPTLLMPMSARPFRSIAKMNQRYMAGFRSIFIHWPKMAPWNIYRQKIRSRLGLS